jgi:2-oxoisovalerate dehydrogenase E2 component (dihydrolipoyl transacylase)
VWLETDATAAPEPEASDDEPSDDEPSDDDPSAAEPSDDEPSAADAGIDEAAEAVPAIEMDREPAPAPDRQQDAPVPTPRRAGALAAPAVRRRAAALDVDLAGIAGTGPDGRVQHEDLDRAVLAGPHVTGAVGAARPSTPASSVIPPPPNAGDVELVKVSGLRRNIAKRMQESSRRIAHFAYVEEVDVTELERLRAELNRQYAAEYVKLSLLPFLMRAVVIAVAEFPQVNARFDDDAGVIEQHRSVHIGIATQTSKGLMVPVVQHAETGDLWTFAAEVARLSAAARDGSIGLQELHGSTITITSLGALGGIVTTPVINHPEVAVIGVNKIATRPVWVEGAWLPRSMMNLSSSFDHRVIDGWDAAQFIQRIRTLLEHPALLFVP